MQTNQVPWTKEAHIRILLLFATLACLGLSTEASAKTCELSISANDQIQYNKSKLVIGPDCTEAKLTLKNVGKLPVQQMGHNWTLTRTEHWKEIAQSGQNAGLENDYLPKDDRIIAHTHLIGGGETTSITLDVSKLEKGGDYTYFCSFPGHWVQMNGKLVVQ